MESSYNYNTEVCIVGLGPAGIGAALTLSNSHLSPHILCLDAGGSLDRFCSVLENDGCKKEEACSMISGLGGSSLLGGHKFSTFPAGSELVTIMGSPDIVSEKLTNALNILKNYLLLQQPEVSNNIISDAKKSFEELGFEFRYYDSYICGQEELKKAYKTIFLQLQSKGVSILTNTDVIEITSDGNGFRLVAKQNNHKFTITTKYLVLGIGRFGRNLLTSLNAKWNLSGGENHLEAGIRLEFPTELFSGINKYHNDLKLLFNNARTFCVSKDGKLAPYCFDGIFIVDGYYNPTNITGFTNLAIMVRLKASGQNEAIFNEIRRRVIKIGGGKPVRQMLTDYLDLKNKNNYTNKYSKSSISFWEWGDVDHCFPQPISSEIKDAVYYFISRLITENHWGKISVFAPAIEYNWPSFPIKSDFSIIPNMYLIGDCTGRFRGILQAFCSGMVCAESIRRVYEKKP